MTLKSGVKSLRSLETGEIFHPGIGPQQEAELLHVKQQNLVLRAQKETPFVIWDVGLGAAANGLTAIQTLVSSPLLREATIEIHSFDQTLAPAQFALEHAHEFDYLRNSSDRLRQLLVSGAVKVSDQIRWELHLGEFGTLIQSRSFPAPHAVFYDPYSAPTNYEMWTLPHFQNLFLQLDASRPCLLSNYTCSTAVRASLLLAGFFVGRGRGVHTKRETTLASNQLSLLDEPLDLQWLERVKNSTNSAPLRGKTYAPGGISAEDLERLKQCPQFQSTRIFKASRS